MQSYSPAPRWGVLAPLRGTVFSGTTKALSMLEGTSSLWRQYLSAGVGVVSRARPPTTTGIVVGGGTTPLLVMKSTRRNTPSMITASPRIAAAGQMLVVVVTGGL